MTALLETDSSSVIHLIPARAPQARTFNNTLTTNVSIALDANTNLIEIKASADGAEVIASFSIGAGSVTTANAWFSVLPGETRHIHVPNPLSQTAYTHLNVASVDGTNAILRVFEY